MQGVNEQYLMNISNQFLHILKTLQTCKGWTLKQQSPLSIEEIAVENRTVVKTKIKISIPFQTVLQFFSNPGFMQVLADGAVKKFEILYDKKEYKVIRLILEPPGPISIREIIAVNTVKVDGSRAFCGNRSCNYFPFQKDPDSVLAEAHVMGIILDKIDSNTTLVTQISDMDIKGAIPVFVQNAIASKRANSILKLEQKIKNYKK